MNSLLLNLSRFLCFFIFTFPYTTNAEIPAIVFIGRSGSGVSATIKLLLGNAVEDSSLPNAENLLQITEYSVFQNGTPVIKFIDVPGLFESEEEDTEIFQNLEKYISTNPANIFVTTSNFDDTEYKEEHSQFVQLLRKVVKMQENLQFQPATKNVLHFNYLLSETRLNQRKPGRKLEQFLNAAERYAPKLDFEGATVGENDGDLNQNENGMFLLPNKETYPMNLLQIILNVTKGKESVQTFIAARNTTKTIQRTVLSFSMRNEFTNGKAGKWNVSESGVTERIGLRANVSTMAPTILSTTGSQSPDNLSAVLPPPITVAEKVSETYENGIKISEIHRFLSFAQTCFEKDIEEITELTYRLCIIHVNFPYPTIEIADLAHFFYENNLTDLPKTNLEKTKFFLEVSTFMREKYPRARLLMVWEILKEAYGIEQTPYPGKLVPGMGYDILSSKVLKSSSFSGFQLKDWIPTEVGYKLPPNLIPILLRNNLIAKHNFLFEELEDNANHILGKRMDGNASSVQEMIENYEGLPLPGYNVIEDLIEEPVLTSAIEVRTSILTLDSNSGPLHPQFVNDTTNLSPVNLRDRHSVKDWQEYFGKYGTHIVQKAFYGGVLQATVSSEEISTFGRKKLEEVLGNITAFYPVNVFGGQKIRTNYTVFGGEMFQEVEKLSETEMMIQRWKGTIPSQPVPLQYEVELLPIFTVAKSFGEKYEEMVKKAWKLYLRGELKYQQKINRRNRNNSSALRHN